MKDTLTLIRAARGPSFHVEHDGPLGPTSHTANPGHRLGRCGRQLPGEGLHRERGVDVDVVRLAGYPVCAECRRLTDHDRARRGREAEAAPLF